MTEREFIGWNRCKKAKEAGKLEFWIEKMEFEADFIEVVKFWRGIQLKN
ncbi:hypothetical protein [Bacillus niameyensis]|nr:hypothetical protein [Bacillus niameyensis]